MIYAVLDYMLGLSLQKCMFWHSDPSMLYVCRLWYLERDGGKAASTLVSVDSSVAPPSYAVRIDKTNSVRYAPIPSTLSHKPVLKIMQLTLPF